MISGTRVTDLRDINLIFEPGCALSRFTGGHHAMAADWHVSAAVAH